MSATDKLRHARKYRILAVTARYACLFGCVVAVRAGVRSASDSTGRTALGPGQYPWHSGRVSTPGTRAESVPLAHGPSQYPWHTGRVSTPGTRAESVPLAHWPSQYPWHTGRVSTPGTRAESVPLAHGPGQYPTGTVRNMLFARPTGLPLPSPSAAVTERDRRANKCSATERAGAVREAACFVGRRTS